MATEAGVFFLPSLTNSLRLSCSTSSSVVATLLDGTSCATSNITGASSSNCCGTTSIPYDQSLLHAVDSSHLAPHFSIFFSKPDSTRNARFYYYLLRYLRFIPKDFDMGNKSRIMLNAVKNWVKLGTAR